MTGIANRMHDAIEAVRGKDYTVQQGFRLYPTAGTSEDYVYSRHFVDPSKPKIHVFAIEWGGPENETPFHPVWAEMERIILDVTAGLIEFCLAAGRDLWKTSVQILLTRDECGVGAVQGEEAHFWASL